MYIKNKLFFLLLFFTSALTITFFSCSSPTQPPPKNNGSLTLSLEETSSTEAWIKLKTQNVPLPAEINILMDNKALTNITLTSANTTVYINSLQPNKSYQIAAQFTQNNETVSSNRLTVQTLDTTSHNFTWQKFTFGVGASSILRDVAIIDENNIWAVGEIYKSGDPHAYSLAHWDGSKWELRKLYDANGQLIPAIRGIYYFSSSNIWLADGAIHHWDGVSQKVSVSYDRISLIGGKENGQSVNKLWGASPNDLYGVGWKGMIAHYNGTNWQKIESGTDLPINDIYGNYNNKTTSYQIIAVASNIYQLQDKKILSISSEGTTDLSTNGLSWSMAAIWFNNEYKVYAGGDGLYTTIYKNNWTKLSMPNYYIFSIRGNGLNDIIVSGGLGYVSHFNGNSWKNYLGNGIEQIQGNYYSSAIKGNKVCFVGATVNGKAVAIIGRH